MNKSKVVLSIIVCLAVAVTLAVTLLISSVSPSNVYHVGDVVVDHWEFGGYLLSGYSTSNGPVFSEIAQFDNMQTEQLVSFDVSASQNVAIILGNHTYICTSYYAAPNWRGNNPSTITLEARKK